MDKIPTQKEAAAETKKLIELLGAPHPTRTIQRAVRWWLTHTTRETVGPQNLRLLASRCRSRIPVTRVAQKAAEEVAQFEMIATWLDRPPSSY